jgi:Xaa-Pro aminopeptidase
MAATATTGATMNYAERIARAQAEMVRQGIDWLIIAPSSDLVYLIGYPAHTSERLTALATPQSGGEPFIVVPRLEAPRLTDRNDLMEILDLRVWEETENPIQLLARGLGDVQGKTIAVSDQMWSGFLLKLMDAAPGGRFVNADLVIKELRQIKAADELACMREAGRLTDEVWEEFVATTTLAGKTENEAGQILGGLMAKKGLGSPAFMIVASGPGSASPHYLTSDKVIQEGDAVVFDFGGNIQGYKSDITRTVHVGEPSEEFRKVYAIVNEARQKTYEAVRPGLPCEEVDTVARKVITDAGYGEYFIHRVGHGLGLDVHEEPYLVGGNRTPLRPGMVFSDEPGIYIPGKFGIRIEDSVACTETGGELLNNARRDLIVMK